MDLHGADLSNANLTASEIIGADLTGANLSNANFRRAYLKKTNLSHANLGGSLLIATDLREAQINGADVTRSNLMNARLENTIFAGLDLSTVIGLENLVHVGPSSVSTDTFIFSKGQIPEQFLRGCGLSDWEIEETKLYNPNLSNDEVNRILYKIYDFRASQAIQISPLFIAYNRTDSPFVDKLENRLTKKSIRFWRDIHDLKSGKLEKQIDRAIRQNPTVLLVLSNNSIKSDWVEHEVRTARELEKDMGRDSLCPVALDNSWKSSRWPARVIEQIMEYNILDFSAWEDDVKFESMFRKLIDGLELFYKG